MPLRTAISRWGSAILAVLALGAGMLGVDFYAFATGPLARTPRDLTVEVAKGHTLSDVLNTLRMQGLIKRPFYWKLLAALRGDAARIQVGVYTLSTLLSPSVLLDRLVEGQVAQFALTIPEGWTVAQLIKAIRAHPRIIQTQADLNILMAQPGLPGMPPEGWFFPDTYYFPQGTTDVEFLTRAHQAMQTRLASAWASRAPDLPLRSPYEALILASLIEKETAYPQERAEVAAVFIARLNKGMRLETDPTLIYGLDTDYAGDIRAVDLRRDTPFNTYLHPGLPPTPIALPGWHALHAALHPAESEALYFVATGNGRHHFSRTYAEHRQAVIRYQLNGDARRYGLRN